MTSVMSEQKLRRERKHSTSSSASSVSTYSTPTPPRRSPPAPPKRASSAPLITATPPGSLGRSQQILFQSRPTPSLSACSSPSSRVPPQYHAPLRMMRVLPLLPFISPRKPHPHYFYSPTPLLPPPTLPGSIPNMDAPRPHPFTHNSGWIGQVTDANSAQIQIQPEWSGGGKTSPDSALLESGRGPRELPMDTPHSPPSLGGCGPAQEFYSFLNNQALNSDPLSYHHSASSNIWSPPSSSPEGQGEWPSTSRAPPSSSSSVEEGKGEWPSWPENSTPNN